MMIMIGTRVRVHTINSINDKKYHNTIGTVVSVGRPYHHGSNLRNDGEGIVDVVVRMHDGKEISMPIGCATIQAS